MNISVKEFISKLSQENLNILDIREPYSYSINHIPHAVNVNATFLLQNPANYLVKNKTYYIYCSLGYNSQKIANRLNSLGYKVINIIGGYNNYLKESKV